MAITPQEALKRTKLPRDVEKRIDAIVDKSLIEHRGYTEINASVISREIIEMTIQAYRRAGWNVKYVEARSVDPRDEAYLRFSPRSERGR